MKNVCIDFNCNYYTSDYEYENEVYVYDLKRLVVSKVIEVIFKNSYVEITYKTSLYKKGKNTISINISYIDNMVIN